VRLLETHGGEVAARAIMTLAIASELDTAERVGAAALGIASHPEVIHQLAVVASMRGDGATAERHLRAATGDPPHGPSLINLANTLARSSEAASRAESIVIADRAVELMPEDPLAQRVAIMARAHTGEVDAARARLAS
jgi:hypothetical protein